MKVYDWTIQGNTASEVLCYALILSFSENGKKYSGGMGYIAKRLNMTTKTVSTALNKLVAKGLLKKDYIERDKVKYCVYWASDSLVADSGTEKIIIGGTEEITIPYGKKLPTPTEKIIIGGTEKISHNNKDNNKEYKDNNKDNIYITPSDEGVTFEQFWDAYGVKRSKKDAEREWKKLSKADKEAAMKAIPAYQQDCARCDRRRQYAATYLHKETFKDDFSFNDNNPNNNGRDNIRRGAWPTPAENATRAEEWATKRILELTQSEDKGIQGEISDDRETDQLFLPF